MGWFVRKSVRMGPVRFNVSKHGIGTSVGVKGFRVGHGPRGSYVAGGRDGLYFRQRLGGHGHQAAHPAAHHSASHHSASHHSASHHSASHPTGPAGVPVTPPVAPSSAGVPLAAAAPTARAVYPILHTWLLVTLAIGYALGFVLTANGGSVASALGAVLILSGIAILCALDWSGLWSLRGRVRWGEMSGRGHFWLVVAYLCFWEFLPVSYLILAFNDDLADRRQEARDRPRRVAEMEANLGMVPPTEGTCRACGKPLQVGAEFCAFCGQPAVERPLVCPVCAATALPGAKFCPQCRAPLDAAAPRA